MDYEEQTAKATPAPPPLPSLESVITAKTRNLNSALLQAKGKLSGAMSSRTPQVAPSPGSASDRIQRPSDGTYELAVALDTHASVLALFEAEICNRSWPQDDYVGDQLEGYYLQESQSKAKKARLDGQSTGTMQAIPEDEELERRHTAA